jgi:hypothetical protein
MPEILVTHDMRRVITFESSCSRFDKCRHFAFGELSYDFTETPVFGVSNIVPYDEIADDLEGHTLYEWVVCVTERTDE